jgi:hypothetical protein
MAIDHSFFSGYRRNPIEPRELVARVLIPIFKGSSGVEPGNQVTHIDIVTILYLIVQVNL